MPIDSRILWEELSRRGYKQIRGRIICTVCDNVFEIEGRLSPRATEKDIWDKKEEISNQLGQHKHQ